MTGRESIDWISHRRAGRSGSICVPGDGWRLRAIHIGAGRHGRSTAQRCRTHLAMLTFFGPNHPPEPKHGK